MSDWKPCPSRVSAPSLRASWNRASSSWNRGATAAYLPAVGSGTITSLPDGDRIAALGTSNQSLIVPGSRPSSSSSLSASVVKPSPQHLSLGNTDLSRTITDRPARLSSIAAAEPAGPPPTTTTSTLRWLTSERLACSLIGGVTAARVVGSRHYVRWTPSRDALRYGPVSSRTRRVAFTRLLQVGSSE